MSKPAIETELKDLLGVRKIIWLDGLSGYESTDWHVDAFARFAGTWTCTAQQAAA